MAVNLDYEILKAAAERPSNVLDPDIQHVSVRLLAPLIKSTDAAINQRVEYLKNDQLITLTQGGQHNSYFINSITPEGRILLERLENNRFQRRIKDWFFGAIGIIIVAFILHKFGLKE